MLTGLASPRSAIAGSPAAFAVDARDVWSPVTQVTWDFGDGASGAGASVQHAFTTPGTFAAGVTATDAAGNATTSPAGTVAVSPLPPLTLSRVTLRRHRFKVATRVARATSRTVRRGTAFRYSLSERATLAIVLERRMPGRRAGRRCVAPTRQTTRARRCVRFVRAGRLVHVSHPGRNGLPWSGRIGRRALAAGSYRAVLRATGAGGRRSQTVRVAFAVVRG